MQRYTIYLFLWNALHVSGGSSYHQQKLKLHIQHRVLCKTFTTTCHCRGTVVPWQWQVVVKVWQSTRCCICSLRSGWWRKNRPKHVEHEHFTEINKLYNVAACWLYLKICFAMHGPMKVKFEMNLIRTVSLEKTSFLSRYLCAQPLVPHVIYSFWICHFRASFSTLFYCVHLEVHLLLW